MDLVDKLLAAVPKDNNGFEDIDKFWAATDKLTFPFTQRFKTKLFQLNSSTKKVSAQRRSNLSGFSSLNASAINDSNLFDNDSDTDFDYNTSSSVSVVSAIIDDEDDDLSEIEPDESFIREKSTRSSASKSSLLATPLSSDSQSLSSIDDDHDEDNHLSLDNEEEMNQSKSRTSRRSSVSRTGKNTSSISAASSVNATPVSAAANKKKNATSSTKKGKDTTMDQSAFNDITVDEDNFNDLSLLNKSTTTARGRKSSLLSRDSQLLGDGDENDEEFPASSKKTPSKPTDKTHDDTVTASGARSTRSGRSSAASSLTPSGKTQQPSILLSSIKKAKDTNNNANRRVSFGHEALDFNDDDDNFDAHSETSVNQSETVSSSATKKRRQSGDISHATSDMSETTIYHEGDTFELSKSSVATQNEEDDDETHKTQVSEQSDLRNETDDNFHDNNDDNYEYPDETQPEMSQQDVSQHTTRSTGGKRRKAVSNNSSSSSHLLDEDEEENEVVRTPQRRGGATKGRTTPYDMSTPKSQEFHRGTRRLDDTTFVLNSSDEEEENDDKSDDNYSDNDSKDSDKRAKRAKKTTARHTEDGVTSPETQNVSLSFVDDSFLATISSANKKYAGKKLQLTHLEKEKEKKRFLRKQKQLKEQLKKNNNGKLSRELAALVNLLSDESDLDKEIAKHKNLKRARQGKKESEAGTQDDTDALDEDDLFDRDTDDTEEEEEEEEGGVARRSRRATKGMRFAFWKNERPIYEEGVLIDVKPPDPTPRKPRRTRTTQNKNAKNNNKNNNRNVKRKLQDAFSSSDEDDDEVETVDRKKKMKPSTQKHPNSGDVGEEEAVSLPENVSFLEPTTHEVLQIWDDYYDRPVSQQVVYVAEAQPAPQPLPVTGERPRHRVQDVGYAAHFFHHLPETAQGASGFSGWMAGAIDLPPHAIKDAEGVGKYLQVFFVAQGARHALEFGLANPETDAWVEDTAQRLLLSPGDSFYVPPGNIYRLENHSATTEAKLFWMIVYPVEEQQLQLQQQQGMGMSEQTVVSGVSH